VKSSEIQFWKQAAIDLGIDIVAPFELTFPDGTRMVANALVKNFGAALGMVADDDWTTIGPHAETLIALGYGFSCVSIGPAKNYKRASTLCMLADWSWSGNPDERPNWLPARRASSDEEA
jgi:hypothetical protein